MTIAKSYWFVGASYGKGSEDQTERFINEGIWQNGYKDKYLDVVRSMQPGDLIAIKSSYTRKRNLPFDGKDQTASVLGIKAIGVVTKNHNDGRFVDVEWGPRLEPVKEWYFYTNRNTIWQVVPDDWMTEGLVDFTFNNGEQDYKRFCNAPFWRERFGDAPEEKQQFKWSQFYEAIADKLLFYKDNRLELVKGVHAITNKVESMSPLQDKFSDGTVGPLKDICPFTVLGLFNRGITDSNRKLIAKELADFLGVSVAVPDSFEGIPVLNNQRSWFFSFDKDRGEGDIDSLWALFSKAISYADENNDELKEELVSVYDKANEVWGAGWNITMGLYWIRPWAFLTLDSRSQKYITQKLNIDINKSSPKGRCTAAEYFQLLDDLEVRFKEDAYPVHSFPELSLAAFSAPETSVEKMEKKWKVTVLDKVKELCENKGSNDFTRQEFLENYEDDLQGEFPNNNSVHETVSRNMQQLRDEGVLEFVSSGNYRFLQGVEDNDNSERLDDIKPITPYQLDDIISDGCFIDREALDDILERLRIKKNIILQGPPGTGKTWLAKRLAFALMGQKNDSKLRPVQFHPNLSYEDFVRGWRPAGDGKLTLADGPFLEMINEAKKDATIKHVVVIEEINRGNPAQIFGEMLTLIEADKRTPNEALELSYRRKENEKVFVPDNLYIIGTMNIADRSLALVDLALRRRFAFIDLKPVFGEPWRNWVNDKADIAMEILEQIEQRLMALNAEIENDKNLGAQFKIGHSYVTPAFSNKIKDAAKWYKSVVMTEIGPLLDEYWFDDLERARKARDALLAGM